jgi:hypothetical protein
MAAAWYAFCKNCGGYVGITCCYDCAHFRTIMAGHDLVCVLQYLDLDLFTRRYCDLNEIKDFHQCYCPIPANA